MTWGFEDHRAVGNAPQFNGSLPNPLGDKLAGGAFPLLHTGAVNSSKSAITPNDLTVRVFPMYGRLRVNQFAFGPLPDLGFLFLRAQRGEELAIRTERDRCNRLLVSLKFM